MRENEATANGKLLLCPICDNKTRTKVFVNTMLLNYPLFCPKCKNETMVNVENLNVSVVKAQWQGC